MTLHLSRLRLSREPSVKALAGLLAPRNDSKAMDANHRLIWSAFAGDPDRKRDFLWRAQGRGVFYVLSPTPPATSPFFDPPEVKPFAPDLRAGDRLTFVLRANATRTVRIEAGAEGRKAHVDVVMHRLRSLPGGTGERSSQRMRLAQEAANDWLMGQGARHGFALGTRPGPEEPEHDLTVADYSVLALPNHVGKRQDQPQFGVLDLAGTLVVIDPVAFLAALRQGFGRAKAFGCGLMLIRRAPA